METKEIKVRKRLLKLVMEALAILLGVVGGIALAALLHYLATLPRERICFQE